MTNEQALALQKELFAKALDILVKKRLDYSGIHDPFGNFRQSLMWHVEPWRGAAIRLTDKLSRFLHLAENGGRGAVDEAIEDCIIDALNYTVIMYSLWLEEHEKAGVDQKDTTGSQENVSPAQQGVSHSSTSSPQG